MEGSGRLPGPPILFPNHGPSPAETWNMKILGYFFSDAFCCFLVSRFRGLSGN